MRQPPHRVDCGWAVCKLKLFVYFVLLKKNIFPDSHRSWVGLPLATSAVRPIVAHAFNGKVLNYWFFALSMRFDRVGMRGVDPPAEQCRRPSQKWQARATSTKVNVLEKRVKTWWIEVRRLRFEWLKVDKADLTAIGMHDRKSNSPNKTWKSTKPLFGLWFMIYGWLWDYGQAILIKAMSVANQVNPAEAIMFSSSIDTSMFNQ